MSSLSPTLRIARDADQDAIRRIYIQVFERPAEAQFVESIRMLPHCPQLSMIAEVDDDVSGHILLSEVELLGAPDLKVMALEPMAVVPHCQGFGVGSAMINVAIEQVRRRGYHAIVVIGLPDYYPQFGFQPLSKFNWQVPFDVMANELQVLPLVPDALAVSQGELEYPAPFFKLFRPR